MSDPQKRIWFGSNGRVISALDVGADKPDDAVSSIDMEAADVPATIGPDWIVSGGSLHYQPAETAAFERSPMQFRNRMPLQLEAACIVETQKMRDAQPFNAVLVVLYARLLDSRAKTVNVLDPLVHGGVLAAQAQAASLTPPVVVTDEEIAAWLAPQRQAGET